LNGPGFFRLSDSNGGSVYTRDGRFTRDAEGRIVSVLNGSMPLQPEIVIPIEAVNLTIDEKGMISYSTADRNEIIELGRLQMTVFAAPGRLLRDGVLFRETTESGCANDFDFGEFATVLQHFYECSNVDPMRERVQIERARRATMLWTTEPMDRTLATADKRQKKSGM
jgi:flagellar basal-body rod protein FlgG